MENTLFGSILLKLLLYAAEGETGKRLQNRICHAVSKQGMVRCRTIENFSNCLRKPLNGLVLSIILIRSREELKAIDSIGALLRHVRTIIILPDRGYGTIAGAFRLHPRFISYTDSDFSDVAQVAERILARVDSSTQKVINGGHQ